MRRLRYMLLYLAQVEERSVKNDRVNLLLLLLRESSSDRRPELDLLESCHYLLSVRVPVPCM